MSTDILAYSPNQWHEQKVGKARLQYRIHDGLLHLASLRVPRAYRGSGEAKRAMEAICELADAFCLKMELAASPLDTKTSTDGLVSLYSRYGFKPTGYKANPMGDPLMERESVCDRSKRD